MDSLIDEYSNLIYSISKKFYNVEKEDLYQAGCLGLIKAFNNYNEENGSFISYAYKYIFGEMYELSVKCRDIKLNKYYLKLYKLINQSYSILVQELKRNVTLIDISKYLNIDISEIEYVVQMTEDMLSLDDEYNNLSIGINTNYEEKLMWEESLEQLDPLSSAVMKYRVQEDLTQSEVASILGISQVKVSRIESNSKKKILEYIS